MDKKIYIQKLNYKYFNYIWFSLSVALFIFCGANLFQILASSIYPYEFDTSYVINMVIGTLKHGIPNFNNVYGNSIWTCSDLIKGACFNPDIANYQQNDVLPIDHSSGYLLVLITTFFTKLSLFLNEGKIIDSQIFISYIIKGYSSYVVSVYLFSFTSLIFCIFFVDKIIKINLFEKIIFILMNLSIPFCGIYSVTDRIIGEFSAVIYLSCSYIIFSISSLAIIKFIIGEKYLDETTTYKLFNNLNYVSIILFLNLLLSVESKSSVLPTALAVFISQLSIISSKNIITRYLFKKTTNFSFLNLRFFRKIFIFFIGFFSLFIANKFIPLIKYLIFKRDNFLLFVAKSREFINYQSNAGRSWGGDSINFFTNIQNNLSTYNLAKLLIPISLFLSFILFLCLIYQSLKYLKEKKVLQKLFLGYYSFFLITCNFLIILGAWSYSLIYKFPYPRTIFISIIISLLQPICLTLNYKSIQKQIR